VEALGSGCVLTAEGHAAGMLYITESLLQVRPNGEPVRLSHMPGELVHPVFSTPSACLYAHRTRVTALRRPILTFEAACHIRSQL